jgi:CMP/dCMP kinase
MKRQKPIIAIDGPVGVGKSSVASMLAQRLGFLYIDTGAMYRSVTLKCLRQGLDLNDRPAVARLALQTQILLARTENGLQVFCDGEEVSEAIRAPEVSAATSPVADNPQVRERLVALQQEMGREGGVVMEGRDITTVVFPDAEIPIYLDADPNVRAERRYNELVAKGKKVTYEQTLADLNERDRRDRERPVGALTIAKRAMVVDTTGLSQDEVIDTLQGIVLDWMKT